MRWGSGQAAVFKAPLRRLGELRELAQWCLGKDVPGLWETSMFEKSKEASLARVE